MKKIHRPQKRATFSGYVRNRAFFSDRIPLNSMGGDTSLPKKALLGISVEQLRELSVTSLGCYLVEDRMHLWVETRDFQERETIKNFLNSSFPNDVRLEVIIVDHFSQIAMPKKYRDKITVGSMETEFQEA